MARAFASASSQRLTASATFSAVPMTMACWYYPTQTAANQPIMAYGKAAENVRHMLVWSPASNYVAAFSSDASSSDLATIAVTPASLQNKWNFICGTWGSTTDRKVYDGTTSGTNATLVNTGTRDTLSIGSRVASGTYTYFDGQIGHAAVWTVALSADEVARLYNNGIGADPRSVRPDALVAYWPLINNDGDQDYWGNYHLTASGSPTYAQHPPVLMRSRPKYVVIGAASGAPTISSVTITGTRTVSNTLTANVVTVPSTVDSIAYQWEIADDGSGTNAADLSGETAATLALTYADFASRLDANGEAYVRVGAIATVGVESSAESFSDWVRVTAGGSGVVRPIGQSVYISV